MVEGVVEVYAKRIASKNITFTKQYESNGAAITSYPGEIRQLFTTLLMNAMEVVPEGGRLALRVSRSTDWIKRPPPKAFASPSPTAVAEFQPTIRSASSSRSSPLKERTGQGWAFRLLAVSRIGWVVRLECAAACFPRRTVVASQFFCQTENRNRDFPNRDRLSSWQTVRPVPASNRSRCAMSDEFAKSLHKLPDPTKYPQPKPKHQTRSVRLRHTYGLCESLFRMGE